MAELLGHIPVLVREVFAGLGLLPGQVFVDCTAGLGGHAAIAAKAVSPGGVVVLNDVDPSNLERAEKRVQSAADGTCQVRVMKGNFADVGRRMTEAGLAASGVLADLGFSSNQMEDGQRGFSFMREGPLDMRLDPSGRVTAADLVNGLSEKELADLIYEYGEDKGSRRIARKLVQVRSTSPIRTTARLAEVVRSALSSGQRGSGSSGRPGIDPATKTFQALRIAVNDELGCLQAFLASIEEIAAGKSKWIAPGGRVAIITFHSLEDRMVKRSFAGLVESGLASHVGDSGQGPAEDEVHENPRARSAKLRVIQVRGDSGS